MTSPSIVLPFLAPVGMEDFKRYFILRIPIVSLLLLQKLQDGLAVHVRRSIQACDVQDRRRQIDV